MACFALLDLSYTKCLTSIEVKQLTNTSFDICIDKKETIDLFCTHLQTLFCQIDNGGRITNSDLCAPFLLNIGPKFTNLQHKCNVGYLPVEWMTYDINSALPLARTELSKILIAQSHNDTRKKPAPYNESIMSKFTTTKQHGGDSNQI